MCGYTFSYFLNSIISWPKLELCSYPTQWDNFIITRSLSFYHWREGENSITVVVTCRFKLTVRASTSLSQWNCSSDCFKDHAVSWPKAGVVTVTSYSESSAVPNRYFRYQHNPFPAEQLHHLPTQMPWHSSPILFNCTFDGRPVWRYHFLRVINVPSRTAAPRDPFPLLGRHVNPLSLFVFALRLAGRRRSVPRARGAYRGPWTPGPVTDAANAVSAGFMTFVRTQ